MSTESSAEEVKKHAPWRILMGLLTAALGALLIVYPLATATTTALLGWALIVVGIVQFVFVLHSQTVGNFSLQLLLSALYGICGIALAFFPIASVIAPTAILGMLLLVQAGLQIATAFQLRPVDSWGWLLADAGTSLLLGILILAKWPSSSVWAGWYLQDHDCLEGTERRHRY